MLPIYVVGPEPKAGNVLFYHKATGKLQAVKLSESCFTMPITERDRPGRIVSYCYHNQVPEFMYLCQWFPILYSGGKVEYQIRPDSYLAEIPEFVAIVKTADGSYNNAHTFGAALNKLFPFARISTPVEVDPTVNMIDQKLGRPEWKYEIRMKFNLAAADTQKFVDAFLDTFVQQMGIQLTVSILPNHRTFS
jgi:hypothetical protein